MGWFLVFSVLFSTLPPFPLGFVCTFGSGFGAVGRVSPAYGSVGGTIFHVGSAQLLETQPSPQQSVGLTGLFAKQQRNYRPAGLLVHPKKSVWTQRDTKHRERGCTITTSPFFTLKAHSSWGRGPGVWAADPSAAGPCEIFPVSTCSGKLAWMEAPSASGML